MTRQKDPFGKRALFGDAGGAAPGDTSGSAPRALRRDQTDAAGRRAFFSAHASTAPSQPTADASPCRPVVVDCGTCGVRRPVSLPGLTMHLTPSVWLPTRPFSLWMRCPSCRRMTWCRVDWLAWLRR